MECDDQAVSYTSFLPNCFLLGEKHNGYIHGECKTKNLFISAIQNDQIPVCPSIAHEREI